MVINVLVEPVAFILCPDTEKELAASAGCGGDEDRNLYTPAGNRTPLVQLIAGQ
jgi:hypothetical protein